MNRLLPALLPILFALPGAAAADNALTTADREGPTSITISTGAEGGGYWGVGTRLAKVAAKYGTNIEVKSSAGSLDNLQRLDNPSAPTALSLTQSDALAVYLDQEPMFASRFTELESIGKECVFIITATDSGIDDLDDLKQGGHRLAISSETSGSAVTFKAMQSMQPALAATSVVYIAPAQAMVEFGKPAQQRSVDALMMVHRPKVRSEPLKHALFERDQFHLVAIPGDNLDAKLPNGKPVYTPFKLPLVRDNWTATQTLETVCMESLLLSVPDKLSEEQRAVLKRIVDFDWMQIYAEPGQ